MNKSLTSEKLKTKQFQLTKEQQNIAVGIVGIIVVFIIVYIATSDMNVAVEPSAPNVKSQSTGKAFSKPENQVAQNSRDPFALPPQIAEPSGVAGPATGYVPSIPNNVPSSNESGFVPSMVPRSVSPNIPNEYLKLTGIAGTDGQKLAVITSGNKSKSYSVNEMVGSYKVMAITDDYVVLANGTNKVSLQLGTPGQKGGNY